MENFRYGFHNKYILPFKVDGLGDWGNSYIM